MLDIHLLLHCCTYLTIISKEKYKYMISISQLLVYHFLGKIKSFEKN